MKSPRWSRLLVSALICACWFPLHAAPLPRSAPEAQGLSSAGLRDFVAAADETLDGMHSLMIVRHGQVVAEGWWAPYAAPEPHVLFSLSKSFTSTAVGLAVAEGEFSIDDPVLAFFPELAPAEPGANLRAMRVRDLLTMSTGHHDADIASFPFGSEEDLAKAFLALPVAHKPGTHFVYNTPATFMQSAIVQRVTGQTVLDYLRPRLFAPLGIEDPRWDASRHGGISLGGFGLHLRTEDIAKFGQLYLQRGQWQGRQLVPAAWVDLATSRQVSNGSDPASDWEQGYGFQFWRCRHGFYRGDGAFGQFCLVLPEYDAVIAITSGTKNMGATMNLVWEQLLPLFAAQALPEDPGAHAELTARLAKLEVRRVSGLPASAATVHAQIAGRRYALPESPLQLTALTVEASSAGGDVILRLVGAFGEQRVTIGASGWSRQTLQLGPEPEAVAVSGAWTAADTLAFKLCRYRTPFALNCTLRFEGDEVVVHAEQNVGFGPTAWPDIVGRAP